MHTPKVSVVIPVCNVETYLRECLDSALEQTLTDIEIICVDDGSTDRSPEILDEYARKDSRIKVIHKPNGGYGHTMNVGLDAATGEYFAILESDDIIKPNMYQFLYSLAKKHDVDVIKADHEIFVGDAEHRQYTYRPICSKPSYYHKVLNPAKKPDIFNASMQTWSGLYKINFLRDNNIRHNETPGASYQDNGFWFQTFAWASRVYFVDRAFYMLRRDNPNSSIRNPGKVFCIFEEYAFIEKRLRADKEKEAAFIRMFHKKKCDNCRFHYTRVADEFKMDFLRRMADEFKEARSNGELDPSLFYGNGYRDLCEIMDQTEYFHFKQASFNQSASTPEQNILLLEVQLKCAQKELRDIRNSASYKIGRIITFLPRKIWGGFQCIKEHGIIYTIRLALTKISTIRKTTIKR